MNDAQIKFQVLLDTQNLNSKLDGLSKGFTNAGKKLTLGLTTPIVGLIGAGVKYRTEVEQISTSFEVMTGSAEKAGDIVTQLTQMGSKTPFEFTDLASATNLLMNFGFESQEAIDSMAMLGDISQGSADKLNTISRALGKMSSAQKVSLEDINMMIDSGFNPLQEISELTGESMKSLYDRISKGSMSVDEITASMQRSTSEGGKYYNSMDLQSQTLAGRMSTLKDSFNQASGSLIEALLPTIESLLLSVTNLFTWFSSLDAEQQKNILTILAIVAGIGPLLLIIGKAITIIKLLAGAFTFLAANPIILVIGAIVLAIVMLIKHFDKVKMVAAALGTAFGVIFRGIANVVISVFNTVIKIMNNFLNAALTPINALIGALNLVPGVNIKQVKLAIPKIPALATGTNNVQRDGLAYLHQGEAVVPKKYNPAVGGSGNVIVDIGDIILDGQKVGRLMTPYITKTVKVGGGNV
jgi:tape measure domain-containing protein